MSLQTPEKVLIVDPDQVVLNQLEKNFTSQNITTYKARGWEEAHYQFQNKMIDVCLVNFKLDSFPGTALIQKWRKDEDLEKSSRAMVIMTDNQVTAGEEALIKEIGHLPWVKKPLSTTQLITTLQTSLKQATDHKNLKMLIHKIINPLISLGKIEKVLSIVSTKIEPIGTRGIFESVKIHEQMGEKEKALQKLEKLCVLEPQNLKYLNKIGKLSLELGDTEKARLLFEKADAIAPLHLERVALMADVYLNLKEPDKAQAKMSEMLQVNPEKPELKFELYDKILDAGFAEHAQDFCKQTSTPSEVVRHFNNRGVVHSKNKNFKKALDEYSCARKLLPNSPSVSKILFNMALATLALQEKNSLEKAMKLLQESISKKPTYEKAVNMLQKLKDSHNSGKEVNPIETSEHFDDKP